MLIDIKYDIYVLNYLITQLVIGIS